MALFNTDMYLRLCQIVERDATKAYEKIIEKLEQNRSGYREGKDEVKFIYSESIRKITLYDVYFRIEDDLSNICLDCRIKLKILYLKYREKIEDFNYEE